MLSNQFFQTTLQIVDFSSLGVAFWISTGIAILAILISVFLYRKSRRFKRPAYVVVTTNLIQDYSAALSGLKIEYKGKNLSSISVSKVAVWNDGTDTIHGSDIAASDPLRLILKDADLLDANLVLTTSNANQLKSSVAGNIIEITFDFLDKDQGGIIQLIHTSNSSDPLEVKGTVKGALPISRRRFELGRIASTVQFVLIVLTLGGWIGIANFLGPLIQIPFAGIISLAIALVPTILLIQFATQIFPQMFRSVPKAFDSARQVL